MRQVKVCFFSLHMYPLFSKDRKAKIFGGAEVQAYYFVTELAKDPAFHVSAIVQDDGQASVEEREGVLLYKTISFEKKYHRIFSNIELLLKMIPLLYKINADIYIERGSNIKTGIIAVFCKLFSKKFIYMVAHDEDLGYKKPTWMRRPVIGGFQWLFFKLGVRLANVVVVQHGNQLELLRRNYHKDGILRMSAHRLVSGRIPSEEKSGILWVARCEKWKDPTSLIGLARCFRDVSFVMIAPQTPDREFFLSIKEKAAGENNIKFVDHVPFGEIQRSFNKARLFVNTSLSEGFPNTFVQAAMGATPIISLYVDPDGVLEKNKMGLCARGDFNRMVADIKTLLGDEALWQKMSDNAYAYARRNHDIAHIIEDDKQMLVGLMEEH